MNALAEWGGSKSAGKRLLEAVQAPQPPAAAAILNAIATQPPEVGRLFVHLVGTDASGGTLHLSPAESLSATALDGALDAFESTRSAGVEPTVVVVLDAPGSGSFLVPCAAPDSGRVVIASGRPSDGAIFLDAPLLTSFSQKYLASAWQGNVVQDAYRAGRNFFEDFLGDYLASPIRPQIDTNGDGQSNFLDLATGNAASRLYLGRGYAFAGDAASDLPFIVDVCSTQTVAAGEPAALWVRLVEGIEPVRVFAQVVPPDLDPTADPVSSLPEIELTRDPGTPSPWTWSAPYTTAATPGTYRIAFYAAYPDGAGEKLATPAFTSVVVPAPVPRALWVR